MITTDFSAGKTPTTSPADDIVYVSCVFDDATHFITSGITETIQAVKPVSISSIIEQYLKENATDNTIDWSKILPHIFTPLI